MLAACATTAQPSGPPRVAVERTESELQPLANDRYWRLAAEIRTLGDEHLWAGSYARFDGTDSYHCLKLAPESGFVVGFDGARRDPRHAIALGRVREADGWIELVVEARSGTSRLPERLLPVHWGEWRCLLTRRDAVELANTLNAGLELRAPNAYLWRARARATAPSAPELPRAAGVTRFASPVTATVLGVTDRLMRDEHGAQHWQRHVELDFGTRDGAFVGMRLYSTLRDLPNVIVELESVEPGRSQARALKLDVEEPLELGATLSSAPPTLTRS